YKGFKDALLMMFEYGLLQTIFPVLKNITFKDIENRLKLIDDYPNNVFVIAPLLNLFKNININKKIEICKYLKLSNREINFVYVLENSMNLLKDYKKIDNYTFAYLFSDFNFEVILQIFEIHLDKEQRKKVMMEIDLKKDNLKTYIDRIINNNPIVKAENLKLLGIKNSPLMGKLLKEAEKISINFKLNDVNSILDKLKKTNLFKSSL
ncbi:MAG: hypothetical protein K1060chlam5_01311, partial [Candidatus Anoxychlamydiales bacterium]|nr:hypothetical protein [Candidatus Anoxychlamydiales bacterium]